MDGRVISFSVCNSDSSRNNTHVHALEHFIVLGNRCSRYVLIYYSLKFPARWIVLLFVRIFNSTMAVHQYDEEIVNGTYQDSIAETTCYF